jgi:hypothetical protein
MTFVHRSRTSVVLCCVLLATAFTACGDDDDMATPTKMSSAGAAGDENGGAGPGPGGASAGGAGPTGSVARGDYLVNHVAACGDCHTPRLATGAPDMTKFLAGNAQFADVNPADPKAGLLPTPNLTPDKDTGIGDWTDEQIKDAFLNGIDDEGKPLFSVMPYYVFHNMSEEDANSIVLYLRSIKAVNNPIPERQDLGFPVTQAMPVPAAKLPDTTLKTTDAKYKSAENGRYLAANVGVCMECHTKHAPLSKVPLDVDALFMGNEVFTREQLGLPPVFPEQIVSANITPGMNGIEGWTAQDVATLLKKGVTKEGAPICPPMPAGPMGAFGGLTDSDALDIGTYLTTLAPKDSDVIPFCNAAELGAGGMMSGGGAGGAGGNGGAGGAP